MPLNSVFLDMDSSRINFGDAISKLLLRRLLRHCIPQLMWLGDLAFQPRSRESTLFKEPASLFHLASSVLLTVK
ncbi:hypothetical protein HMPREF1621_00553 [Escherichia coli A25922R]|uniref:Uncharacterized protein n=1 Tax=Escherichia coli O45:K1 (strain S88 / ExPEC) TaxID=585035 RepID=B7MJE1_ECO45|nr:hypothetical protein HMPREF9549_00626 [Escherichia coli MS 185-1]EFJ93823.1 hypothetical protein HMPREF9531_01086 [Escherichia coli MS 45-1]EFU46863.1 hypothetical protein HMPREF9539_02555 [Escherichia coli MS 110-3]EFU52428.1 hypothetical protein HMPREF9544_02476 [Escherichia coli MS 153-1]ESD00778.1 hypothetical protein HMPREF1593_00929 [Escherichia coli 907391]ESE37725.1 hypothetical protein HMPREF1621_00553 [Escherichia coli A25922R]CAR02494.1 hypothetical protein ECS88_1168 [Escherich